VLYLCKEFADIPLFIHLFRADTQPRSGNPPTLCSFLSKFSTKI
jgi:hypothetical protein